VEEADGKLWTCLGKYLRAYSSKSATFTNSMLNSSLSKKKRRRNERRSRRFAARRILNDLASCKEVKERKEGRKERLEKERDSASPHRQVTNAIDKIFLREDTPSRIVPFRSNLPLDLEITTRSSSLFPALLPLCLSQTTTNHSSSRRIPKPREHPQVSHLQLPPIKKNNLEGHTKMKKDKLVIFDTTLRDGEQVLWLLLLLCFFLFFGYHFCFNIPLLF